MLAALDLTFEQFSDPDVRSVVIRHEHPEFEQALKEGRRQIEGSDGPTNPRLHLKMHEIVATQLWDNSPQEVWDTAGRLLDAGYERHEIPAHARSSGQRPSLESAVRRASLRRVQAGRQRGLAVSDALCAEVDGGAGLLAPAVRVRVK